MTIQSYLAANPGATYQDLAVALRTSSYDVRRRARLLAAAGQVRIEAVPNQPTRVYLVEGATETTNANG